MTSEKMNPNNTWPILTNGNTLIVAYGDNCLKNDKFKLCPYGLSKSLPFCDSCQDKSQNNGNTSIIAYGDNCRKNDKFALCPYGLSKSLPFCDGCQDKSQSISN